MPSLRLSTWQVDPGFSLRLKNLGRRPICLQSCSCKLFSTSMLTKSIPDSRFFNLNTDVQSLREKDCEGMIQISMLAPSISLVQTLTSLIQEGYKLLEFLTLHELSKR
ncbi:hypothetical protein FGO68_gene11207 [Halteria grandinella]|uniref:Uncharacterized protein n=1 Tax=Halteria grandinella TaxID=5974 RepID=A0A8J8NS67_HALGN|nr:hypothetical protein FGO68_gene11207 [Halteria grandinella]